MHNNKLFRQFVRISGLITSILPILFWLLIIYGFDDPCTAGITVSAAIIHECGHFVHILISSKKKAEFRGDLSGFRIKKSSNTSYIYDILLFASGPMANIITAVILLPFSRINQYIFFFAVINFTTAISNLLPIHGYDGYGILISFIKMHSDSEKLITFLDIISFSLITFISFLSLYILARIGDSYWIAGLFLFSLVKEVSRKIDC